MITVEFESRKEGKRRRCVKGRVRVCVEGERVKGRAGIRGRKRLGRKGEQCMTGTGYREPREDRGIDRIGREIYKS